MSDSGGMDENAARQHLRERIAEIDARFKRGIAGDERIASGISQERPISELDFINMSGLTRPRREAAPPAMPAYEAAFGVPEIPREQFDNRTSIESAAPSFYQRGVADVDDDMPPPQMYPSHSPAMPPPPPAKATAPEATAPSASLDALHALIEDLARELDHTGPVPPKEESAEPPGRPERIVRPPLHQNLLEAEQLLQLLEEQPREQ